MKMKSRKFIFLTVILCAVAICAAVIFASCGETTENNPTEKHDFGEWIAEVPSTCTEKGTKGHYTCSICGKNFDADFNEIINLTVSEKHTSGEVAEENRVEPTCAKKGSYDSVIYCKDCGAEVSRETFEIDTLEHSYGAWISEVPPTCTINGVKGYYHCLKCGKNFDIDKNEINDLWIPALGHNWDEGITIVSATCTEKGTIFYSCLSCVANKTIEIPAQGHNYIGITTNPGCTNRGYISYSCTKCLDKYVEYTTENPLGHNYIYTVTSPDCTNSGYIKHICSRCNDSYISNVTDPLGHNYQITDKKEATCTDSAYITYVCTRCIDTYVTTTSGPLGHYWLEKWSNIGKPYYHYRECTRCEKTEVLPYSVAVWDGATATKFAGGNGTVGSPYQISNAAEWAYFSEYAPKNPGKYYKLTADITFNTGDATTWGEEFDGIDMTPYIVGNWYTPAGDPVPGEPGAEAESAPFIGTFDGQGYTISGFYAKKAKGEGDTVALFGSTAYGAEATIKNLVITNSYFEAADGVAAACVGQAEGGTTTIKNVYVTDTVKVVADNKYAGGVMAHLGQGKFDIPSVVIDGCVNAATVVATSKNGTSVGGILGNGNQKIVTITNCLNMGDVSAYRYVGGILGFGKVDSSNNPDSRVTVRYCVNTGKISSEYTSTNNGKACSIVCFDGTERDVQTAEYCYYVAGTGSYGVFEGKGEGATLVAITDLCDSSLIEGLENDLWIARGNENEYEICIPKGVSSFAPASCYANKRSI